MTDFSLETRLRACISGKYAQFVLGRDDQIRVLAALSQPQPVARGEVVAWIEHHKGGDNLNWDRVDHPYARATPLYKHAVPNGYMMVSAEDVLREISHQASMCRNENPKFSLRLVEASDIFRAHMDAMQSNIDVTFATPTIPTGHRRVPDGWKIERNDTWLRVTRPNGFSHEWSDRPELVSAGYYELCMALINAESSNAAPTGGG